MIYVIAEAGINHNGDYVQAEKLVDAAEQAGADAVKFQAYEWGAHIYADADRAAKADEYKLSFEEIRRLKEYVDETPLDFLCTPFDYASLYFLRNELGLGTIKVGSGEVTNTPFLTEVARVGANIILSTGASTLGEVEQAIHAVSRGYENAMEAGYYSRAVFVERPIELRNRLTLMHCVSAYPTAVSQLNLHAITTMKRAFHLSVGLSDHTTSLWTGVAAVALGAEVLEKHITLDKLAQGPDQKSSLVQEEFVVYASAAREVYEALGPGDKVPVTQEMATRAAIRRSLVAVRPIKRGEFFQVLNVMCKRTDRPGMPPNMMTDVIGNQAQKDYEPGDYIEIWPQY